MMSSYEEDLLLNHNKKDVIKPIIQCITYEEGEHINFSLRESKIIFLLEGEVLFNYDKTRNRLVSSRVINFLPPAVHCSLEIKKQAKLFVIRLRNRIWITKWFSLEKLFEVKNKVSEDFFPLLINDRISFYLESLLYYLNDGLLEERFYELKVMELFYLLKKYYRKEELASFFNPLLNKDIHFSDFILTNYIHVKTVKEFAALNNQSVSVFEKEFRRVFKESPYQWMKKRKINKLLHEIKYTKKTFKEICYDCGFSSPSQLSDFCKKHFSISPAKIRKGEEIRHYNKP